MSSRPKHKALQTASNPLDPTAGQSVPQRELFTCLCCSSPDTAPTASPRPCCSAPNLGPPLLTPPPRAEALLRGLSCRSLPGPCAAAGRTPRLPWQRWHRQGSVSPACPAPSPVSGAGCGRQVQLHLPRGSWSSSCRWSLSAPCASSPARLPQPDTHPPLS